MAIGELKKGKDVIRQTAEGGGGSKGRYTSYISWKVGESKSIYFITPIDDVPKVQMHNYVKKTIDTDNGPKTIWMTFMCRKDAAWREESGGYCPLCDDIGHAPQERFVSLAVEVEPTMEGKRVVGMDIKYREGKDSEGNKVDYPQVGLIQESAKLFFNYFVAQDQKGRDLENMSWEITREGEGLAKQFIFYPLEHKPNLEPIVDFVPSLESVLESLGNAERYDTELEGVTAEEQTQFGNQKSSNGSTNESFEELKKSLKKKKGPTDVIPY